MVLQDDRLVLYNFSYKVKNHQRGAKKTRRPSNGAEINTCFRNKGIPSISYPYSTWFEWLNHRLTIKRMCASPGHTVWCYNSARWRRKRRCKAPKTRSLHSQTMRLIRYTGAEHLLLICIVEPVEMMEWICYL